jgi:hypothetical protein
LVRLQIVKTMRRTAHVAVIRHAMRPKGSPVKRSLKPLLLRVCKFVS